MATPRKIRVLAAVLLLATVAIEPASAGRYNNSGGGSDWGAALGAGILGGIIGGAIAPAPQRQIIVVPAYQPPPPATVIIVPAYQPPQRQTSQTVRHIPLINSCIGGGLANGRLTIINNCGQAATVTWGLGNYQRGERVAFTAETILPAGASQVWAASNDNVSWAACPYGMHVVDAATGQRATGASPDQGCR
jgi:hypothetical protein